MALTPQQEQQITQLLTLYAPLMDIGAQATEIEGALGYGDVRVIDLPVANPLNPTDVMYVAQQGADVQATGQQFGQFVYDAFVSAILAAALAQQQANIDASLQTNQRYFIGQA